MIHDSFSSLSSLFSPCVLIKGDGGRGCKGVHGLALTLEGQDGGGGTKCPSVTVENTPRAVELAGTGAGAGGPLDQVGVVVCFGEYSPHPRT